MTQLEMFSFLLVLFFINGVHSNFISDLIERTLQEKSPTNEHNTAGSKSLKTAFQRQPIGQDNHLGNYHMVTGGETLINKDVEEKSSAVGTDQKYEIADVFAFVEVLK